MANWPASVHILWIIMSFVKQSAVPRQVVPHTQHVPRTDRAHRLEPAAPAWFHRLPLGTVGWRLITDAARWRPNSFGGMLGNWPSDGEAVVAELRCKFGLPAVPPATVGLAAPNRVGISFRLAPEPGDNF